MKRNSEELEGSSLEPPSKKPTLENDDVEDNGPSVNTFLIKSQNRSLNLEILRNKRTISEARKELEMMRRKTREMEALVSLIQRAWSQLDIDAAMLLDSLGDSEVQISSNGSSELLYRLLHSGRKYVKMEPTNTEGVIDQLDIDQYSTNQEIEEEQKRAETKLLKEKEGEEDNNKDDEDSFNLDVEFGGRVDENLEAHISFTLSLLERLCNAIHEEGVTNLTPEAIVSITEERKHHALSLMLKDRITKLSAEIIHLKALLQKSENERARIEKNLDKSIVAAKEAERKQIMTTTNTSFSPEIGSTSSGNPGLPTSPMATNHHANVERELQRQISLLEQQLAESESAKSKVEMTLTERLARPLTQTESQVSVVRKSMEELRQQCKQRVAALVAESESQQEKIKNLELAVLHVETASKIRIDEILVFTEKAINKVKEEKEELKTKLSKAQAELAIIEQIKTQLTEYQTLTGLCKEEVANKENQIKLLTKTLEITNENLKKSRDRETQLEQSIQKQLHTDESDSHNDNEINCNGNKTENVGFEKLWQGAQERLAEMERELEDARTSIDDLILEIEAVTAQEVKARTQGARLLQQIGESQNLQRTALDENLQLQNQIEDLKQNNHDIEQKMKIMKNVMSQQEQLIPKVRSSEIESKKELQELQKTSVELQGQRQKEELNLEEAKEKVLNISQEMELANKRNNELMQRCKELSQQCEKERQRRLEAERESSKLNTMKKEYETVKKKGLKNGTSTTLDTEDSDMLEMTLGMLRCSVCKDRFKSAAITRCYHLFCKECIDENLRNRSRKCPACGEKFGQDDVTNIYFTH